MLDKCCGNCYEWLRLAESRGRCFKALIAPPGVNIDNNTSEDDGATCPHYQAIGKPVKPWEVK
jgi:hypothetical protein